MTGRSPDPSRLLRALGPAMARPLPREQVRAAAGAGLGLLLCAALVTLLRPAAGVGPALIAPLGATAVLVFAVPNSPLAQPWSAVVGNTLSALVALAVLAVAPAALAVGLAVGGAILAMTATRSLHPPGGAVALLLALDPEMAAGSGFAFALAPVGLTTAALVAAALAFNRLTGRVYPFRQAPAAPPTALDPRLGLSTDDLRALLDRFNQSANLGVADLGRLLAAAEMEAAHHRFDAVTCGEVMTRSPAATRPEAPAGEVARLLRARGVKSLPVIDEGGRPVGLVTQADLLAALAPDGRRRPALAWPPRAASARDVMRPLAAVVDEGMPVGVVLNAMAAQAVQAVPVTRHGRLAGVLTRSDVIALLLRGAAARRAA